MRDGRDEDFVAFVAGCSVRLHRLAAAICPDPARSQDLVQEALIATYLQWPRVRNGDPWAYLRACLVNKNISHWRRRPWRESSRPSIDDMPEPRSYTDTVEARQLVREALRVLTQRERTVVVLRYLEELTERETAETMQIAVGTVKSTCARALAKLSATVAMSEEPVKGE